MVQGLLQNLKNLQCSLLVEADHLLKGSSLDLGRVTCSTKRFITRFTDVRHRIGRCLEELARIEVRSIFRQVATNRSSGRHTQVCVDVDLAHTGLNAFNDLIDGHTIGFPHVATVVIDDLQP